MKFIVFTPVLFMLFLLFSCQKDPEPKVHHIPEIRLDSIRNILMRSAEGYATLISDGGDSVRNTGFCFSQSPDPTMKDNYVLNSSQSPGWAIIRSFTSETKYYIRAFAVNTSDTGYSNQMEITSWNGQLSDIDGNAYAGVQIGNQGWMAENLRTLHYSDGTLIKPAGALYNHFWYGEGHNYASDREADLDKDGDLDWDDGTIYINTFGLLYTWHAATNFNYSKQAEGTLETVADVCPEGWHLPTEAELRELVQEVDSKAEALKSVDFWYKNPGSNSTGFNARPGGSRGYDGEYHNLTASTTFWSSEAENSANSVLMWMTANSNSPTISIGGKDAACAIRCVKDR